MGTADDCRIHTDRAIVVEGRDDADAVSRACDALIIPTHGFGITAETWSVIAKAHEEKGLIILTDPDHAGEEIRRRLSERFPGSVQCYLAREDALRDEDIGVENASPEAIGKALLRALSLHGSSAEGTAAESRPFREVTTADLAELGLTGADGASQRRAAVCRDLGIGCCNGKALLTRLRGFRIGYEDLRDAVSGSEATDEEEEKQNSK